MKKLITITAIISLIMGAGITAQMKKKKDPSKGCNTNRFKSTVKYGGPRGFKLVKFIALTGTAVKESAALESGKTYNVYTISSGGARKGINVTITDPKGKEVAKSSKNPRDSNLEFKAAGGNYTIQFALDDLSKNCGGAGLMVK